jgi:uncharacterized protein YkwD
VKKYNKLVTENKKKQARITALNKKVQTLESRYDKLRDSLALSSDTKTPATGKSYTAGKETADRIPAGVILSPDAFHSGNEKLILYYINYARTNPQGFLAKYVLPNTYDSSNSYAHSLIITLRNMKPVDPLGADQRMFESALCHAIESGKSGYVGHQRNGNCKVTYNAECCAYASYMNDKALRFVLQLLVDQGVPSLGHREIILSSRMHLVGIAIRPHKAYGENVVLDFLR